MNDIKAIETIYNGYRFRSRLEARWAVFFDALGIEYEYEPEGLVLSDGSMYLPDFYLPQFYCYFEVKRRGIKNTKEGAEAIKKISDGMNTDSWAGVICFGDPVDHDMMLFCQAMTDSGGGPYEGKAIFGYYPGTQKPCLLCWDDHRDRTFLTSFNDYCPMPVTTDYDGHSLARYPVGNIYIPEEIIFAENYARRARFEHGETPRITPHQFNYSNSISDIPFQRL